MRPWENLQLAADFYRDAIKLSSERRKPKFQRMAAWAYRQLGDCDEALLLLNEAIQLETDAPLLEAMREEVESVAVATKSGHC